MYCPAAFSISDAKLIREFVAENSFGIIVSHDGTVFHDTHTPLFLSEDMTTVTGHIARANSQWKSWVANPEVKIIFHGPHTYISPAFYVGEFNVPTWNYTAVSISGNVQIVDESAECVSFINSLVKAYEGENGWRLNTEDERYMKLFDAIVCFRISVTNLEAKFKLNQNKPKEEQESVISYLLQSGSAMDRDVAELMQKNLNR